MTTTLLVETVAAEIRDATRLLKLPIEYHNERERRAETTWRQVRVYEQYIPADLFQNDTYYPCVIVEWLSTTDRLRGVENGSTATVGLSFGVYAKEADAWKDCLHLMEVVRQRLLEKRTLAKRFRLEDEITWETAANQPTPFFYGYAELNYQIYQMTELPLEVKTKWRM